MCVCVGWGGGVEKEGIGDRRKGRRGSSSWLGCMMSKLQRSLFRVARTPRMSKNPFIMCEEAIAKRSRALESSGRQSPLTLATRRGSYYSGCYNDRP